MQLTLLLAVMFVGSAGCTQEREPCLTPKIASLNIECVHFPTDTATTTIDTLLPAAGFGAVTDSGTRYVIYSPSSNFTISLSSRVDSCRWLFSTDSAGFTTQQFDTLDFYYQRKLQFLSNACGYTYFYVLNSVKLLKNAGLSAIDSVLITNASVTNDVNVKQLKIFIHPDF